VIQGIIKLLIYNDKTKKETVRLIRTVNPQDALIMDQAFKKIVNENKKIRMNLFSTSSGLKVIKRDYC